MEKEAWRNSNRKFAAQVRVQAQGTVRKWPLARWATSSKSGAMTEHEVEMGNPSPPYVFHSKYATSNRPMARVKAQMEIHMLTEEEATKEKAVEADATVVGPQAVRGKREQGGGRVM